MKKSKFNTIYENIVISEGLWDKFINFITYDFADGLPKGFPIVQIQRFCRDNDFFVDENHRNRFYTYLISRLNQNGYLFSFEIPVKYIKEKVIKEGVIEEGIAGFQLTFLLQSIDNTRSKTWKIDINYKTKADELTEKIERLIAPYGLQFHHNGRYPYTEEMKEHYLDWLKKYEKEFQAKNKYDDDDDDDKTSGKSKKKSSKYNTSRRRLIDDENMSFSEILGFFTLYGFDKMDNSHNVYIKNQGKYRLTIEINYDDFKDHRLKRDLNIGVFDNVDTREETFKLKPTKDIDQEQLKNKIESFVHKTFKDDDFFLKEKI